MIYETEATGFSWFYSNRDSLINYILIWLLQIEKIKHKCHIFSHVIYEISLSLFNSIYKRLNFTCKPISFDYQKVSTVEFQLYRLQIL